MARPIEVLIACPGVGHVVRGFESFAEECFEALRGRPELNVTLVGGRGRPGDGRLTARVPPPGGALSVAAGRLVRRPPYTGQQMLFASLLAPLVAARRPDVLLISDWLVASAIGRWRWLSRQRYTVLLSNGAGAGPHFDRAVDHVQHLTPASHRLALDAGEPPERHTLLPLGVAIPPVFAPPAPEERAALRARLGLPADEEILLSAAALNAWSKRLPYLVDEVASLERRPHLLLLGQPDEETPEVLRHARERLGEAGHTVRTVPRCAMPAYYRAADMFVLASRYEAMGRVLVEALSHGLPVLAHDAAWARFVVGAHGRFADLGEPGALRALIERARAEEDGPAAAAARHGSAYERFSWDRLAPRYVELFRTCAGR
jgi:1,2-diacylglycerol 3-alpha-glucosyltransferase